MSVQGEGGGTPGEGSSSSSMDYNSNSNVAGGVASLGGSLTSGIGNRRALKYSNRNFNATMAFNERMASTQYQRAVKDLMAAGLNPMLAYMNGGASAASVTAPPPINEMQGVSEGLYNFANNLNQTKLTNATVAKIDAETRGQEIQNAMTSAELPYGAEMAKNKNQHLQYQWQHLGAQIDKLAEETGGIMNENAQRASLYPLATKIMELEEQQKRYGIPAAKAEAEFWSKLSAMPQSIRFTKELLHLLQQMRR